MEGSQQPGKLSFKIKLGKAAASTQPNRYRDHEGEHSSLTPCHLHVKDCGDKFPALGGLEDEEDEGGGATARSAPKRRRTTTQELGHSRRGSHVVLDSDEDEEGSGGGEQGAQQGQHAVEASFQGKVVSMLSSSSSSDDEGGGRRAGSEGGRGGRGGRLKRMQPQGGARAEEGDMGAADARAGGAQGGVLMQGAPAVASCTRAAAPGRGGAFGAEEDSYDPDALEEEDADEAPPAFGGRSRSAAKGRGAAAGAAGGQQKQGKHSRPRRSSAAGKQRQSYRGSSSEGGEDGSGGEEFDEEYDEEEDAGALEAEDSDEVIDSEDAEGWGRGARRGSRRQRGKHARGGQGGRRGTRGRGRGLKAAAAGHTPGTLPSLGGADLSDTELQDADVDEEGPRPAQAGHTDFSGLHLKADHGNRPLWATPDGHIFLETFSQVYKQAQDFLVAIAEPVCRPEHVHEYQLTPHSLYAAVSVGLDTETIISVLNRLSKVELDKGLTKFIRAATQNYGKVKLVLKRNRFFVETSDAAVFELLKADPVIKEARTNDKEIVEHALRERAVASLTRVEEIHLLPPQQAPAPFPPATTGSLPGHSHTALSASSAAPAAAHAQGRAAGLGAQGGGKTGGVAVTEGASGPGFFRTAATGAVGKDIADGSSVKAGGLEETGHEGGRLSIDDVEEGEDEGRVVRSFEIQGSQVETVKKRCLPGLGGLNLPMLEEYDFRNDRNTPDLNADLKPHVKLRPYQEKSLSKMFGNGRARSGIIVLPCGAGKSLVGVAAAARMRKSCLCLCTSSVSVDQWKHQFMLWTGLQDHQVARFTSESKEQFGGVSGVTITTFTMVAFSGKRSDESEKVMEAIRSREWGLLLLDEVHVVPAAMFRKVIGIIHAHCKLGLTATLVREDERIGDLNFLIGPKLYEANWLDLTRAGHIANVQCVEVWCPMTKEFFKEYLKPVNSSRKQLLYVMNPNKFMACQFLITWHERERKDKIIVFSDNIWALREYAQRMHKPFIYGPTSHAERTRVLHAFKNDPNINTVFLSKVGDNSLDIPEANVLIQISSHAGSRRQEAQRLGRILRAKQAKAGYNADGSLEFNAFFYTLVSTDTQEMFYSTKRQQFLVDQGYAFKVVTNLVDTAAEAMAGGLMLSKKEDQLDLLCRVLTAGLEEAGVERGANDDEDEALRAERAASGQRSGSRRMVGTMGALSGAAGLRYLEYSTGAAGAGGLASAGGRRGGFGGRGGGRASQSDVAKKYQRALGLR